MPTSTRETPLCRYHYDPLDRLADSTTPEQAAIHRHYCKTRLATELQGAVNLSILQHEDQLLAQQQRKNGKVAATLLAVDKQRSVLSARGANQQTPITYSPYGHRPAENGLLSLLGFNGERPDPVTGHYHLGNGYRQFNPMLMRFNCRTAGARLAKVESMPIRIVVQIRSTEAIRPDIRMACCAGLFPHVAHSISRRSERISGTGHGR